MEVYGIIYLIENKINNKMYIGQTTDKNGFDGRYQNDLYKHTHNEYLKRSIHKYGIENFKIDKEFDFAYSKKELDKLEDMYIKMYDTTDRRYGYNRRGGGSTGKMSKETKKKMSIIATEQFAKGERVSYWSGKKFSNETKKKISDNHADVSGKNNPMYGKERTVEDKLKISKANSRSVKQIDKDTFEVIKIWEYADEHNKKYFDDNGNNLLEIRKMEKEELLIRNNKIIELYLKDYKYYEIEKKLNLTYNIVHNVIYRYKIKQK